MASVFEAKLYARETGHRAIAIAFAVSLALHVLLIAAWPTLRDPDRRAQLAPGPIIARLLTPEPPEAAPAPETARPARAPAPKPEPAVEPAPPAPAIVEPERKAPPTPRPAPAAARSTARDLPSAPAPAPAPAPIAEAPKITSLPKAEVAPAPIDVPRVAEPPSAVASASLPLQARMPSASAATSAPVVTAKAKPAAAPEAPDPGAVAQYRLDVIESARRYKRYPRVALDNNWEGRATVRMVVAASGTIASLDVSASAGHAGLDREAIEMIRQAGEQTQVPAGLRGRGFAIEIPVIFSLRDAGA